MQGSRLKIRDEQQADNQSKQKITGAFGRAHWDNPVEIIVPKDNKEI